MNVQHHARIVPMIGISFGLVMCSVMGRVSEWAEAFPLAGYLDGTLSPQLVSWVSALFPWVVMFAFLVGLITLLKFLLVHVFGGLVPAYCRQPGCAGRSHLVQTEKSLVYVCDQCGDVVDTHFSIGGDD